MKKKTVFLIVSICLLVIAIVLFLVYRNCAFVKSLSDYDNVKSSYEKTTALPVSDLKNLKLDDSLTLEDGAILTKITYEEYLKMLTDNKEINSDNAKLESFEIALTYDEAYSYYYYKKVFPLDGSDECDFKAQLGAMLILDDSNSYAQIVDAFPIKTHLVTGPNNCEWVQSAVDSFPALGNNDSPMEKVELFGRGYFQVKYSFPFEFGWNSPTLYMAGRYKCS